MTNRIITLAISFFFLTTVAALGQSPSKIKKEGEDWLKQGEYQKALAAFDQIKTKYANDLELRYQIGRSYFELENMTAAAESLTYYIENEKKPNPKAYYYLARMAHLLSNFPEAAKQYKSYIKTLDTDDSSRQQIKLYLLQCTYGASLAQLSSGAVISNLGNRINSPADDYRACFHPNYPYQIWYSSNRTTVKGGKQNNAYKVDAYEGYYRPDIYSSELKEGAWSVGQPLSDRYNSNYGESMVGFFDGGYQLVSLKEIRPDYTEVVTDNFDEDSLSIVLPFALGAGSNAWDGDHFFPTDSSMIFSSNRTGGYGGKDLYYSQLQADGTWSEAQNMGAVINTPYDEVGPFLTKNGRKLYFSSNNTSSIGGFDIYSSIFDDASRQWSVALNEGTPINSPADDRDFWLDKDGMKVYFTSNRLGGIGGLDIYVGYYRQNLIAQLSSSTPKTFVDILAQYSTPVISSIDSLIQAEENLNPTPTTPSSYSSDATTYSFSPIYYDTQTGELDGANTTIKTLVKLLKKYPLASVTLLGHTNNTGNATNDLYLTLKQAELVAQQLIEQGVQPTQIYIKGCGQNYPVAHNENFDDSPSELSHRINARIDLLIHTPPNLELKINNVAPQVSPLMQSPAYTRFQKKMEGLSYQVKITTTSSLFVHPIFETDLTNFSTEKNASAIAVDYMVGLESTFIAIKSIHSQAEAVYGFSQAEIIPYVDGKRITKSQARNLVPIYPDLRRYLEYLTD